MFIITFRNSLYKFMIHLPVLLPQNVKFSCEYDLNEINLFLFYINAYKDRNPFSANILLNPKFVFGLNSYE